jgi:hypothetical protein
MDVRRHDVVRLIVTFSCQEPAMKVHQDQYCWLGHVFLNGICTDALISMIVGDGPDG